MVSDHINEARARLERDAESLAKLEALAAIVPDSWPVSPGVNGISTIGAYTKRSVLLEVKTRAEAVALAESIDAAPIAVVRLGCVGVKPVAAIKPGELERAEIHDEILPWVWEYSPGADGGGAWESSAKLRGYWNAPDGGGLVGVSIAIADDPARVEAAHERTPGGRRIVRHRWTDKSMPNGERIGYSSGSHDRCGKRLFYFWREPGGGAPTLADYLGCSNE